MRERAIVLAMEWYGQPRHELTDAHIDSIIANIDYVEARLVERRKDAAKKKAEKTKLPRVVMLVRGASGGGR